MSDRNNIDPIIDNFPDSDNELRDNGNVTVSGRNACTQYIVIIN